MAETAGSFAVKPMVVGAYQDLAGNFQAVMRMAVGWIVLEAACLAVGTSLVGTSLTGDADSPIPQASAGMILGAVLILVGKVGGGLGLAAAATAWLRSRILDEPLTGYMAPVTGHTWRYVGAFIKLALLCVPAIMAMAGLVAAGGESGLGIVLGGLALIAMLVVMTRLELILAAAAIGDGSMTLARAWERTRGSTGRIMAANVLASLPFLALEMLLSGLAAATGAQAQISLEGEGSLILTLAGILLGYISAAVYMILLARIYMALVPPQAPESLAESRQIT